VDDGEPLIRFFVPGVPQPAGSKRAMHHKQSGKIIVLDDARKSRPWKERITGIAIDHKPPALLAGPLFLSMSFRMPRPKDHWGTGRNASRLKSWAPLYHTGKPDLTKLVRAAEDACTGVIWSDDSCIARQSAEKHYGEEPGVYIKIWRL
jgi:Holliday junction resolvase RusA-like endonuclease